MKNNDAEPLPGSKNDKPDEPEAGPKKSKRYYVSDFDQKISLVAWLESSREYDELRVTHPRHGFHKVARAIISHIARRQSDERGCDAGLKDMALYVGSHIDHVKHELKKLVALGIVIRMKRPGDTSVLRLADKRQWLLHNPPNSGKKQPPPPPEETREQADRQIRDALWTRIWNIPGGEGAPKKPFEKMMDKELAIFERVVTEMENRVKRGLPENRERMGPDALKEVKNFTGLFVDMFGRFCKANGK